MKVEDRPVTWVSRGDRRCTGQTMTLKEQGGTVERTTCGKCTLDWSQPVKR